MIIRISRQPTQAPPQHAAIRVQPARVVVPSRAPRVLDFDLECRPLHFYGDYVSKEITAIAWAWCDRPKDVTCLLLGEVEPVDMLERFRAAWNTADMVTGHFIRGFDIPLMCGALSEYGLPMLADKWTHDTKLDLVSRHGMSGSQENIGSMLGLKHDKVQMDQARWRSANRLTKSGLALAKKRVVGDVQMHIEMRAKLLELGYLSKPKRWSSRVSSDAAVYTP